jgi:hypothetical protein
VDAVTGPYGLCLLAAAAATCAASAGWWYSPDRRAHRRHARDMRTLNQRRIALERQVAAEWLRVKGQLAVRDAEALLLRLLAVHPELHDLQATPKQGGA